MRELADVKASLSSTDLRAGGKNYAILATFSLLVMWATNSAASSFCAPCSKTTIAACPITGDSPAGPEGSGAIPQSKPASGIFEAREIWLMVIAEEPEK